MHVRWRTEAQNTCGTASLMWKTQVKAGFHCSFYIAFCYRKVEKKLVQERLYRYSYTVDTERN